MMNNRPTPDRVEDATDRCRTAHNVYRTRRRDDRRDYFLHEYFKSRRNARRRNFSEKSRRERFAGS